MSDWIDVENSTFLDAINSDEIPRHTKCWRTPTLAEVESFVELTKRTSPQSLNLEEMCKNSLGFYLVINYYLVGFMTVFAVLELPPRCR